MVQRLMRTSPDIAGAKVVSDGIRGDLNPDGVRWRALPEGADGELYRAALLLCAGMVDQIGKPKDPPAEFASVDPEAAETLRQRVRRVLERCTGGRYSGWQEGLAMVAAHTALVTGDPAGRQNILATALLAMWPQLPFVERTFERAVQIAGEMV